MRLPDWYIKLNENINNIFQNRMTQEKINAMLVRAGIPHTRIPQNLAELMTKYGIILEGDAKRFLANSLHETSGFRDFKESGYYTTTKRLQEVFPSAFGRPGKVGRYNPANYLKNEKKLLDLVYDDRLFPEKGLGNMRDGDGSLFKGRGSQMTTGFKNYLKLKVDTGIDFVSHPEWLETDEYKFISGLSYWKTNKISNLTSLLETRKAIVGKSAHGYDQVLAWYNKLK